LRLPDTRTIKVGLGERLGDRSIVTRDNCEVIIHWDESWGNRRRLICLEFIESQPPRSTSWRCNGWCSVWCTTHGRRNERVDQSIIRAVRENWMSSSVTIHHFSSAQDVFLFQTASTVSPWQLVPKKHPQPPAWIQISRYDSSQAKSRLEPPSSSSAIIEMNMKYLWRFCLKRRL
jgi:hypothetical protein